MFGKVIKTVLTLLKGLLFAVVVPALLLLGIPIYAYRWFVLTRAKLFYKGKIGKPVTSVGSLFAIDFLSNLTKLSPRCSVVCSTVVDGKVATNEIEELINTKWLKNEDLIYPELSQYLYPWMGFMFWKPDLQFNLKHHIKSHIIVGRNDDEVEDKACGFVQDLLNSPFHSKRSPWEFYIINMYKNEKMSRECVNGEMTLLIFRFHHSLADGFSSLKAMLRLFGTPLRETTLPATKQLEKTSWRNRLCFCMTFPIRMLFDCLNLAYLLTMKSSPLQVPDLNKSRRMLCQRLPLIPIENIKNLKNKLGVTFTDILLTGLASGLAKTIHRLDVETEGNTLRTKTTPLVTVLPLPGHPNKLRNHFTFAFLELPTELVLDSLQRLKMVTRLLKNAKRNTVPFLTVYVLRAFGSLPTVMMKLLRGSLGTPVGLTNFSGNGIEMEVNGKTFLTIDFVVGTQGASGVGFMIFSFRNQIRIIATVEEAVMDKLAAKAMLEYVKEEFDNLNKLSTEFDI